MPLQFITVGRHAAARSGRSVATLIAGLALVAASAAPALADPGAPGAADETVRRFSVGLFSGALLHSEKSGLGNAHYSDDVPQSGAAFGLRLGYTVLTGLEAELELLVNPTTMPHPPSDSALVLGGRLLARYELLAGATRPYLTAGFGQLRLQTDKPYVLSGDMDNTWIAGAGVIFDASYRLALRADARWVGGDARPKSGATLAHNVELTVGVSYAFGGPPEDRDGDGIPDDSDKCPEVAEDKDGYQDDDGCVDADNDNDGVPDAQDKCPDEAEDQDGYQDGDGCPDRENDGDGVPDDVD
jgi:hypothetical protein